MKNFYRQTSLALVLLCVAIMLCRFTNGAFVAVIVMIGLWAAWHEKFGFSICCYILLPFLNSVNPALIRPSNVLAVMIRFGSIILLLGLVVMAAKRQGKHRLPLGGIIPFLIAAYLSSTGGYAPKISYLKIINYFMFILGIWLGTQNLQNRPRDILQIRAFIFSFVLFIVFGSLALRPFPAISYATGLSTAIREGGRQYAETVFHNMVEQGEATLFCGVVNHSQTLAPFLALSFIWLVCDMLFIEKRFRLGHVITIVLIPPMLFMTRSRTGLLIFIVGMMMVYLYTIRKIEINMNIVRHLRTGTFILISLIIGLGIISEVRDRTISKWLRKSQDVEGDTRTLTDAVTSSRMGLVEESMRDFRRNPLWGTGFQVAEYHSELERRGKLVFSAPIEKGVLPTMILGETGIVGVICFIFFLGSFYLIASSRKLFVTCTCFTLLLVSNSAEASFFSPSGTGSVNWILTVVGGFTIDTVLLYERNMAGQWKRMMQQKRISRPQEGGSAWS